MIMAIVVAVMSVVGGQALSAQTGLNIAGVFTPRFRDMPEATETLISRGKLKNMRLSLYHSLTIKDRPELAEEIERMVAKDGAAAVSKEVRYASGRMHYGFYALPPKDKVNRYIMYLNGHVKGDDRILLLYLEGEASMEDVRKLVKRK